jgi:hypothetical protein
MTRSFKKNPIGANCCCGKGSAMRLAKRKANRVIRRVDEELPGGNYYRKIVDRWSFPDDGKRRHSDPKVYRK